MQLPWAADTEVREFTQENYFGAEDAEVSGLFAQTKQAEAEVAEDYLPRDTVAEEGREIGGTGYKTPPIDDTDVQNAMRSAKDKVAEFIPEGVKKGFRTAAEIAALDYSAGENTTQREGIARLAHEMDAFTQLGRLAGATETVVDYTKSTGRKVLRTTGMDAATAQDVMSIAEGATYIFQPLKAGVAKAEGAAFRSAARLSRTTERACRSTHDFMQRAAALNRPQPAFAKASSGATRAFMVDYQPATKPMPTFSSMKARSTGGTVSGGQAPSATASAAPVARPSASGQVRSDAARVNGGQTVRERLFGTNDVAELSAQRVRPIGNNRPRNQEYAGKTFYFDKENLGHKLKGVTDPSKIQKLTEIFGDLHRQYPHGVPFTGNGYIDLSRYAVKKVDIPFSGNSIMDIRNVNRALGWKKNS